MKIAFVAGFGPIVRSMPTSQAFYGGALGLPFDGDEAYMNVPHGQLDGVKHFALWPLSGAAESCFGALEWPAGLPVPQAWVEFDVDDVAQATAELVAQGHQLLVSAKQEPWGQTVSRLLSPEGLLVGLTYTPSLRAE
jgi:catechol 2,3-dioxygenase-like lactoylglutathione lyase family enzyme